MKRERPGLYADCGLFIDGVCRGAARSPPTSSKNRSAPTGTHRRIFRGLHRVLPGRSGAEFPSSDRPPDGTQAGRVVQHQTPNPGFNIDEKEVPKYGRWTKVSGEPAITKI